MSWYMLLARRLTWVPGVPGRVHGLRLRGVREPFYLRGGTNDSSVFDEIFLLNEYGSLSRFPMGEIRLVLDLGSNIGLFARFCQINFPNARVVAVEPDADNVAVGKLNTGVLPERPVTFIQACVAAKPGTVHLDRSRGSWGYKMVRGNGNGSPLENPNEEIEAITVPGLLQRASVDTSAPIDLLKCDIEGAESELFADCREWIGRVRNAIVELHPPYASEACLADLRKNGGDFVLLDKQVQFGTHEVLLLQQNKAAASA
jgi:FkbM family methyltransferase